MMNDYYNKEIIKMGKWALKLLDGDTWHTETTSKYFKNHFGFGKGALVIQTIQNERQHAYFPKEYFDKLYTYIKETNQKDYLELDKKLREFYNLKNKFLKKIKNLNPTNFSKLKNEEIIKIYRKNREITHHIVIFDQFGWTAEDYWIPVMRKILIKHGLKKDSKEYHDILFALTKPEEISTTLCEKRDILKEAINISKKRSNLNKSSKTLTEKYAYLPVFIYGTPWNEKYYKNQLNDTLKTPLKELENEYQKLINYSNKRNQDINKLTKKYNFSKKELQIFIDFGLTLDVRNEAEFIISLMSFKLLPLYKEVSKRLNLSIDRLRDLCEEEIIKSLKNEINPKEILKERKNICGWGFDEDMKIRYFLSEKEAQNLFNHLNKNAKNIHGHNELKGICASSGNVKGTIRIMHGPEDNNKVKQGDILVAHATTVDYLPAMKKAAAFITEIGGLTCHAAVVAREFGVPCIVSLKNATINLKDGEKVEIKADSGIIKKI